MGLFAVVVAGFGPYDLALLRGIPAVRRAVCSLLSAGIADNVTLFAPPGVRERALDLCAGLPVRLGGSDVDGADGGGRDGVVVMHEASRPLAPPALAASVLAAVRAGAPAAVPVLPLTDTVKRLVDGELHAGADRDTLRVVQSPVAFRAALGGLPCGALDLVARCGAAGEPVHTVAGDPAAFALRTEWDVELAGMVLDGDLDGDGA